MSRSMREYLQHILDETDYLSMQSRTITKEKFLTDGTLKRAFVRSIEIIGEAARSVPDDVRARAPSVPWAQIVGTRHILAHAYGRVDPAILWALVDQGLAKLEADLAPLLLTP